MMLFTSATKRFLFVLKKLDSIITSSLSSSDSITNLKITENLRIVVKLIGFSTLKVYSLKFDCKPLIWGDVLRIQLSLIYSFSVLNEGRRSAIPTGYLGLPLLINVSIGLESKNFFLNWAE